MMCVLFSFIIKSALFKKRRSTIVLEVRRLLSTCYAFNPSIQNNMYWGCILFVDPHLIRFIKYTYIHLFYSKLDMKFYCKVTTEKAASTSWPVKTESGHTGKHLERLPDTARSFECDEHIQ
jgi:hypothetical protein